mmetsp:Transcript_7183/g.7842  ORF Transcript_7183/g.7842 Transcript_7183/m.7842 type:complete len:95 (-) Transcript_7183:42-326(-)
MQRLLLPRASCLTVDDRFEKAAPKWRFGVTTLVDGDVIKALVRARPVKKVVRKVFIVEIIINIIQKYYSVSIIYYLCTEKCHVQTFNACKLLRF